MKFLTEPLKAILWFCSIMNASTGSLKYENFFKNSNFDNSLSRKREFQEMDSERQEWGFSRLQNQGCRFLQHAKIFSHHAKIFDANLIIFSKTLDIKCCIKKWVLTKMAKILGLQKIFLIMQNFLYEAAKTTCGSPKSQGYFPWRLCYLIDSFFSNVWNLLLIK